MSPVTETAPGRSHHGMHGSDDERNQFVNITGAVREAVRASGVAEVDSV